MTRTNDRSAASWSPGFSLQLRNGASHIIHRGRLGTLLLLGSAVGCVVISFCYWAQPDLFAAATLIPAWCWLILGGIFTVCGYSREHRYRFLASMTLWFVFTVLFVEQAHSLLRFGNSSIAERQSVHEQGNVRIVSLNCGMGRARSAEEVTVWEPDIVLLQESPSSETLERLSKTLFGEDGTYLQGGDASILARGRMEPRFVDAGSHYVHARVDLFNGLQTEVISVRLAPPVIRLDFWTPGFWIDHRDRRIKHRQQIAEMMKPVKETVDSTRWIVGGDFNSPAGDGALFQLERRLFDTFRTGGHGWGCTGTNEYPLFRVDQIWASRGFQAKYVTAYKTLHSDHRMVVCDLIVDR